MYDVIFFLFRSNLNAVSGFSFIIVDEFRKLIDSLVRKAIISFHHPDGSNESANTLLLVVMYYTDFTEAIFSLHIFSVLFLLHVLMWLQYAQSLDRISGRQIDLLLSFISHIFSQINSSIFFVLRSRTEIAPSHQ